MTMSIPSTDAMASALAIASGVSSITATVVWASKKSSSSRCGMGWNRLAAFGPATERWPRGGNRHASAMRSASSAVSTCGTMTPIAPMSSDRVRYW